MKINTLDRINWWFVVLILLSLLPLRSLATPGMFVAHDAQDHVARIANFYQSLSEGNIVPRWAGNLNWGYGHPVLMFLYPLPSYIASLFISLGFSIVDATKLVFAVGFVGSGISMFLWIKKLWGTNAAFVSAVLYMFAPYRFVDLYVRGAIGENFFFIFPPLACYFVTVLFTSDARKGAIGAALSVAGMMLSHNALMLMFLPFIGVYTLLFIFRKPAVNTVLYALFSYLLGFGLSAFFFVPAFFEGKYTLRDIVTGNDIFNRFESIGRLFNSPWNYGGTGVFSVQVGMVNWILMAIATGFSIYLLVYKGKITAFQRLSRSVDILLVVFALILFFWLSILLMLPVSQPLYELVTTLKKFQFPWRFLSLSLFPPAVIGGLIVAALHNRFRIYLSAILVITSIFLTRNMWNPQGYFEKPESFYSGIYPGTTDTGESAPRWSVRFMEQTPAAFAEISEGEGTLTLVSRNTTTRDYKIEVASEKAHFLENTLYFPGWVAKIDGVEIPPNALGFHNPQYRGLINFPIEQGAHTISIEFRNTKLRGLSETISIMSGILLLVLAFMPYIKKAYNYVPR